MLMAVMGFALVANAQADQCSINNGNGGYLKAYVSSTAYMNSTSINNTPFIKITTEPSKTQPADGSVLCKITYERESDGQRETVTRSLDYKKNQSHQQSVDLDSKARRIVSIEIWGAECKSVNRNNY